MADINLDIEGMRQYNMYLQKLYQQLNEMQTHFMVQGSNLQNVWSDQQAKQFAEKSIASMKDIAKFQDTIEDFRQYLTKKIQAAEHYRSINL